MDYYLHLSSSYGNRVKAVKDNNLITKIDKGYKLYFCEVKKIFIVVNSAKNNQICLKTSKLSPKLTVKPSATFKVSAAESVNSEPITTLS